MNKLPLSHRAKCSQMHATALPRHVAPSAPRMTGSQVCRHRARTFLRTRLELTHPLHELLMLRSKHPATRRGTHERSRNHVWEAALARACDRRQRANASELRVRLKFEQAGTSMRGQLLGCREQQKVQKAGHALARQMICGRL